MFRQIRRVISIIILVAFTSASAQAAQDQVLRLPAPGVMVHLSQKFTPAHLQGLTIHPDNALQFDFLISRGDNPLSDEQKKEEYSKLVKYFLASLTIPDEDQWVNLSPYEKNRIIKDDFGQTEMGRDLLSQDYILKQVTSSLIYPESSLGKEFWARVYDRAYKEYGATNIPINTFNKVWIIPDEAAVYESGNTVYILRNHLKVMLEEDYLSLQKHNGLVASEAKQSNTIGSRIVRQVVLPELEREVNEGRNFANLRQIYSGMILATWYKHALKESLLGKIYANQAKVKGVDQNPQNNQIIYRQYLKAFKKGVFNYIKEDVDKYTNQTIPRKYFSGGAVDFAGVVTGAGATRGFSKGVLVDLNEKTGIPSSIADKIDPAILSGDDVDSASVALDANTETAVKAVQPADTAMTGGLKKFARASLLSLFLLGASAANTVGQTVNPLVLWMRNNVFAESGMPKSFEIPKDPAEAKVFWSKIGDNTVDGVVERITINDGLEVYDGAVWQTALALAGGQDNLNAADVYTKTLNSGSFGDLSSIRAWDVPFTYQGKKLPAGNGYFFRLISPRYYQYDPLTLAETKSGFPEQDRIHWADWMPVTGENAWVILSSLQLAYAEGHGTIDVNSPQVQLALSVVPALKDLTTDIGAILYAPKGAYGKSPNEISNENNVSAHAALMMLYAATKDTRYLDMARGIEDYFKTYGYDENNHVFYQGGSYAGGKFSPNKEHFAEDVQAWGILEFSPAKIDEWHQEGEAYQIWKATKQRSGVYKDDQLVGIGYTQGHSIQSGEWSYGAIGAALELARYYQDSHPDWSKECLADAVSMLNGQEQLKHIDQDGSKSYLYANKRSKLPFGWWANPIPSLASTGWAFFIQSGYNPFVLGGKTDWFKLPGFKAAVDAITAGQSIAAPESASAVSVVAAPEQEAAYTIIRGGRRGDYSADGNYSSYMDFRPGHDFTAVKSIRITFPSSEAGVNFAVRLLPKGTGYDSPTGLSSTIFTIPTDGVVVVPISEFESIDLTSIIQLSIHSGHDLWGDRVLNEVSGKKAVYSRIETIDGNRPSRENPPPVSVPAAVPAAMPQPVNLSADEQEADQWINNPGFQNRENGDSSEAYEHLKAMGERAVGPLIKIIIKKDANLESRKWASLLLVENATAETAPEIAWALQQFRSTAATPQEKWVSDNIISSALGDLRKKFGFMTPVKPSFIKDGAMSAVNGGIDFNSANLNLQIKRDGKGIPLPLAQQDMAQLNSIQGFVPEILEIKPAVDLPILNELQQKL